MDLIRLLGYTQSINSTILNLKNNKKIQDNSKISFNFCQKNKI